MFRNLPSLQELVLSRVHQDTTQALQTQAQARAQSRKRTALSASPSVSPHLAYVEINAFEPLARTLTHLLMDGSPTTCAISKQVGRNEVTCRCSGEEPLGPGYKNGLYGCVRPAPVPPTPQFVRQLQSSPSKSTSATSTDGQQQAVAEFAVPLEATLNLTDVDQIRATVCELVPNQSSHNGKSGGTADRLEATCQKQWLCCSQRPGVQTPDSPCTANQEDARAPTSNSTTTTAIAASVFPLHRILGTQTSLCHKGSGAFNFTVPLSHGKIYRLRLETSNQAQIWSSSGWSSEWTHTATQPSSSSASNSSVAVVVSVVCVFLLVVLLVVVAGCKIRTKIRMHRESIRPVNFDEKFNAMVASGDIHQAPGTKSEQGDEEKLIKLTPREVKRRHLQLMDEIGAGQFGKVRMRYANIKCMCVCVCVCVCVLTFCACLN